MEAVKKDILKFISTTGSGSGDGYGDGYGSGDGSGDGDGSGSGDGSGYGSGDGSKQKYLKKIEYKINGKLDNYKINLKTWQRVDVYYIDDLPCTFISVKNNLAKVHLIDVDNLTSKECFIGKFENCFAHADSAKNAMQEAANKHFSLLDIDSKILQFKKEFPDYNKQYSNESFYKWHTILTGSCSGGKEMFIKNKSISLTGSMSVNDFIKLTATEYNGQIINRLK